MWNTPRHRSTWITRPAAVHGPARRPPSQPSRTTVGPHPSLWMDRCQRGASIVTGRNHGARRSARQRHPRVVDGRTHGLSVPGGFLLWLREATRPWCLSSGWDPRMVAAGIRHDRSRPRCSWATTSGALLGAVARRHSDDGAQHALAGRWDLGCEGRHSSALDVHEGTVHDGSLVHWVLVRPRPSLAGGGWLTVSPTPGAAPPPHPSRASPAHPGERLVRARPVGARRLEWSGPGCRAVPLRLKGLERPAANDPGHQPGLGRLQAEDVRRCPLLSKHASINGLGAGAHAAAVPCQRRGG
jgi:hypothetical protein